MDDGVAVLEAAVLVSTWAAKAAQAPAGKAATLTCRLGQGVLTPARLGEIRPGR